MKRFIFLLFLFFTYILCNAQYIIPKKRNDTTRVVYQWFYFGVSLKPNYNELVTYAVIRINKRGEREYKILSKSNFIMQLTGQQRSDANPNHINLMEKYEIKWQTLDALWKLRYNNFPFEGSKETGYTKHEFLPSPGQWAELNRFGLRQFNDFCMGDTLFNLLKSLQDPVWVEQYKIK